MARIAVAILSIETLRCFVVVHDSANVNVLSISATVPPSEGVRAQDQTQQVWDTTEIWSRVHLAKDDSPIQISSGYGHSCALYRSETVKWLPRWNDEGSCWSAFSLLFDSLTDCNFSDAFFKRASWRKLKEEIKSSCRFTSSAQPYLELNCVGPHQRWKLALSFMHHQYWNLGY